MQSSEIRGISAFAGMKKVQFINAEKIRLNNDMKK